MRQSPGRKVWYQTPKKNCPKKATRRTGVYMCVWYRTAPPIIFVLSFPLLLKRERERESSLYSELWCQISTRSQALYFFFLFFLLLLITVPQQRQPFFFLPFRYLVLYHPVFFISSACLLSHQTRLLHPQRILNKRSLPEIFLSSRLWNAVVVVLVFRRRRNKREANDPRAPQLQLG